MAPRKRGRPSDDLESHGRLIELGDGLYDLNGRCVGLIERCQGPSWGWTVGEALGATLESKRPGAFTPITDRVGGGPFHPKASHSGSP